MRKEVITYNYLADYDIHEIVFDEASRKSMDEYIGTIYEIYDEHLKGRDYVKIMLDIHKSGMLPVNYASAIMEKTFKELAPFPKPYIAYLTERNNADNFLITTMDFTASRMVQRFNFAIEDREQAIQWLNDKDAS